MFSVSTFASGSSGNCLLVSDGNTHILVDAGISFRRITQSLKQLGLLFTDLKAVLITHEHRDHICGLATMVKNHTVPIYAGERTAWQLTQCVPRVEDCLRPFSAGTGFEIGGVEIASFRTPHDTPESVGYRLTARFGKMGVMTDLGHVPADVLAEVSGVDLLVLEANHDIETLTSGAYPYFLKRRILGDHGHLSNEASAKTARVVAECGARRIVLAHLSRENNTPEIAYNTVAAELRAAGITVGRDIELSVAPRAGMGTRYIID